MIHPSLPFGDVDGILPLTLPNKDVQEVMEAVEKDRDDLIAWGKKNLGSAASAFEKYMRSLSSDIYRATDQILANNENPKRVAIYTETGREILLKRACNFEGALVEYGVLKEVVQSQRTATRGAVQDMSQQFGRINLKEVAGTERVATMSLGTYSFPSADKLGKCVAEHKLIKDPNSKYLQEKGVVKSIPHAFADDTAVSEEDMRQRVLSNLAVHEFDTGYEAAGLLLETVLVDCAKK